MLDLATALGYLAEDEAIARLQARLVPSDKISDAFDLAEALFGAESLRAALTARHRAELAVLRAMPGDGSALSPEELAEASGLSPQAVDEAVAELRAGFLISDTDPPYLYRAVHEALDTCRVPGLGELNQPAPPVALEPHRADTRMLGRWSADAACRTIVALAELVWSIKQQPVRMLARGGIGLPDLKRFGETTGREHHEIDQLIRLARSVELLVNAEGYLSISARATSWLANDLRARYADLSSLAWARQPAPIRRAVCRALEQPGGAIAWPSRLNATVATEFPMIAADDRDRMCQAFLAEANLLGHTVSGEPSPVGIAVWLESDERDAAIAEIVPECSQRLWVQPDLSIISPGPLDPACEAALRPFVVLERAELATSFRLSADSVARGIAAGGNAEAFIALLEASSGAPIPQSVAFVVRDTAERARRIRVYAAGVEALPYRTLIEAERPILVGLLAERALAALALRAHPEGLASRVAAATVLETLLACGHPAMLEAPSGPEGDDQSEHPGPAPDEPTRDEPAEPSARESELRRMWARITAAGPASQEPTALLGRTIEAAIRSRSRIRVSIELPNGEIREYDITPSAVVGGRVRGKDLRLDVERTLPLAALRAVSTL